MRTILSNVLVLTVLVAAFAAVAGESESAERRLAIIKALKIKGVVGENNRGLLEFRASPQAEEVVAKENAAREKAYKKIAAKQDVSWEKVGAQRAAQLAKEAPAGTWLQGADGQWRRKE